MTTQLQSFHPITKFFAYLGAGLCFFFGVVQVIGALLLLPDILKSAVELFTGILIMGLAYSFYHAAKFSSNPFTHFTYLFVTILKDEEQSKQR